MVLLVSNDQRTLVAILPRWIGIKDAELALRKVAAVYLVAIEARFDSLDRMIQSMFIELGVPINANLRYDYDADLVVFSDDPLRLDARVLEVYVSGVRVYREGAAWVENGRSMR